MLPDLSYSMLHLTRLAVVSSKLSPNWRCTAQAHAEEEIDFTKVLRTGQTPYAKMDYQAPQSEGWVIAAVRTEHLVAETGGCC